MCGVFVWIVCSTNKVSLRELFVADLLFDKHQHTPLTMQVTVCGGGDA